MSKRCGHQILKINIVKKSVIIGKCGNWEWRDGVGCRSPNSLKMYTRVFLVADLTSDEKNKNKFQESRSNIAYHKPKLLFFLPICLNMK